MLVSKHTTKTGRTYLKVEDHRLGLPLESGTHVTGFFAQSSEAAADVLMQEMNEDRVIPDALRDEAQEAMVEFLDGWLE